jgi:hypothetical protein
MTTYRSIARRFSVISFIFLIGFFSCKKDKLEGDTAILEGKWNWTASYLVPNRCDVDSNWIYTLKDSVTENSTYSLEFLAKGKLIFRHNDGTVWNQRLIFESKEEVNDPTYDYRFLISLDGKTNDPMTIWVGSDSLLVNDYPKDTDVDCEEMFNHFVRE